jgi:hypothetical protein
MSRPFESLQTRTDVASCCKNRLNLEGSEIGYRTYKATCKVCGRGHVEMLAEPFKLGLSTNDTKRAVWPHPYGDGGPAPTRKIILPKGVV